MLTLKYVAGRTLSSVILASAVVLLGNVGVAGASSGPTIASAGSTLASVGTWSSCPEPLAGAQYQAPGESQPTVALTFDDGPGASTAAIVRILQSFNVRASFFNIGINEVSDPTDVVAEARDGFTLNDHSWTHPALTSLSSSGEWSQIAAVASEQRALVGSSPCGLRPPYGAYDATTLADARAQSMSLWMWNVDTEDWKAQGSGTAYWVQRIVSLAESEGGSQLHPLVLLHNQVIPMPATLAALPLIIRYFEARHYHFVDLLGRSAPLNACPSLGGGFAHAATLATSARVWSAGEGITSPSRQYTLRQFANGALAVVADSGVTWSTPTTRHPGARSRVLPSGYLVVQSRDGRIVWQSATGHRGDHLALGDDGSLLLESGGHVWWRVNAAATSLKAGEVLHSGWSLETANGECRLYVSPAGHLLLQSAAYGTLWTSPGVARSHSSLVLDPRGDLVLVSPEGAPTWASESGGRATQLTLDPVGRAYVANSLGHWEWSTP